MFIRSCHIPHALRTESPFRSSIGIYVISNWVNSIAWSPDGSRFASASDDMTVRIWDPATGQRAFTLDIHSPSFLQFDKVMPNRPHTNVGTLNLGYTGPVASSPHHLTLPRTYGYGLSDDSSWITYNGFNLLRLPAEYRPSDPSLFPLSATTVAIGCPSGRVIFLALSEHNPLYSV
jgi:WD40 repeat protein